MIGPRACPEDDMGVFFLFILISLSYGILFLKNTNETTTALFYGRVRPDRVVKTVVRGWFPQEDDTCDIEESDSEDWMKENGARDEI